MANQTRIKTSRVFTKIRKADKRIIVNEGSSRSTKTFSILQYLIMKAHEKKRRITIARQRLTWAKATVMVDFFDVLSDHFGYDHPQDSDAWMKSESEFTFPNGSIISFIGLDEPQKIHGRKQDITWINEAIEASHKNYEQLGIRTTEQIILDYNPSVEQHWIYEKVIPRDDCTFIKSTYKDNPFLTPAIRHEIERLEPTPENIRQGTADEVSWKIYGLGERAAHKGLIFGSAKLVTKFPDPQDWKKSIYGIDFGFTNDPTALTHVVLAHGELWLRLIFYKRGLTNIKNPMNPKQPSIQEYFEKHNIPKNVTIWADSAEPKAIADLKGCGYMIKGATKGPDSVTNGILTMKQYLINIMDETGDATKEKNNYKWKEDNAGNPTNTPIDAWNHFWDSARYPVFMEMRKIGYNMKGMTKM